MDIEQTVIAFGGEVKALTEDGRFGGYAVLFGTPETPDLSQNRDFFTKETDFGCHTRTPVLYHHGLDADLKNRVLTYGNLKADEVGIWLEAQLALRDQYERDVWELVKRRKVGLSTGTAAHLVEREAVGQAHKILRWPLGLDASLTPTPAEPRTQAMALKALLDEIETKARPKKTDNGEEFTADAYLIVPDPDKPSTWKVRVEETPGEVTVAQLGRAAAALTTGFRGQKVDASEEEIEVALRKLRGLYRKMKAEPPEAVAEKKSQDALLAEATFEEHTQSVLAAVAGWQERMQAIRSLREAKVGRVLSQANRDRLTAMCEGIESAAVQMRRMLEETVPNNGEDVEKAVKALLAACRAAVIGAQGHVERVCAEASTW